MVELFCGVRVNLAGGCCGPWKGLESMLQTRSLLRTLASAFFIATLSHAALLPNSLNISIESVNMRHILKWSSLHEACSSVSYTVQFQGQFESMQNNGSGEWKDVHSCINISQTECDLSLTLGSDSDYIISMLTQCDNSTLSFQLPKTFNRRDTVLLAPKMDVKPRAGQIEVYFHERQDKNHINLILNVWKKGNEQSVSVYNITGQRFFHYVLHGEGEYCLRAVAVLELNNNTKYNSSAERCVHVRELEFPWLVALAAGIAVTLSIALAVTLGLTTPRCSLWIRKSVRNKEALPSALLDWPKSTPTFSSMIPQEMTHSVFLLDSS